MISFSNNHCNAQGCKKAFSFFSNKQVKIHLYTCLENIIHLLSLKNQDLNYPLGHNRALTLVPLGHYYLQKQFLRTPRQIWNKYDFRNVTDQFKEIHLFFEFKTNTKNIIVEGVELNSNKRVKLPTAFVDNSTFSLGDIKLVF